MGLSKLWYIKPPLEVFYPWNIAAKCKPAYSFLPRTCVSTCPTWQNSATLRRRTQSSPLWSSWTTSTISALSVTFSMASSTASTTNGESELQCSETNQCIPNYVKYQTIAVAQLFSYSQFWLWIIMMCVSLCSPYVIGTMNQGVSTSPNLELHHNFRFVTGTLICTEMSMS